MKNAVAVLGVFVGVLFFGTLIGDAIFIIYGKLSLFVAGMDDSGHLFDFFIGGISFSLPLFCILASLMSILYSIRHPNGSVLTLVFLIVLNAGVWLFVLPEAFSLGLSRSTAFELLSSLPNELESTQTTMLETTIRLPDAPVAVLFPLSLYSEILTSAVTSWKSGYLSWLSFASIFLVFTACYGLKNLSGWKLLSGAWTAVVYGLILFFNGYVRKGGIFDEAAEKVSTFWNKHGFFPIEEPFVVAVNIVVALVLLAIGIFLFIYRRKLSEEGM